MKPIFQAIWDAALPYQDKRDDWGHAAVVTTYAERLLELVPANENIVIPAAILHDIGWSQLSEEDRFYIFAADRDPAEEQRVRVLHQEEGVRLAQSILEGVRYPLHLIPDILEIISQHDTRKGFISREEQ